MKQDYYAWTWGDALFVVISPFWTTTTKPYTTATGGGEGDTTGTDNRWLWTLGQTQFNWLQVDPGRQLGEVQVRLCPSNRGGKQTRPVK